MKLVYIANIRVPTEKAHGLQIFQNAEAMADAGTLVELWGARRTNTPELRAIRDPFAHYGVKQNFKLVLLPTLDLLPLVPGRSDKLAQVIFGIQWLTFTLMAALRVLLTRPDIVYTRDALIAIVCGIFARKIGYEPHTISSGRIGRTLQKWACQRAAAIFPLTQKLAEDLITMGGARPKITVVPDGVRAARFAGAPDQAAARQQIGWDADQFVVGYLGRLHTMNMEKGVGTLIDALLQVPGAAIALVGGPDEMANAFRADWIKCGGGADRFLYAGQVAPDQVPLYLSAFDVCAMPLPFTPHFAYYASPLKLFEYMAAQRAIISTDLPSFREILTDGETALLVPPSDVEALADAIRRLQGDTSLRARLAANAYDRVMAAYTWAARARIIVARLTTTSPKASSG